VLTIHDLCVIDHPEWFDPKFALWYRWLLPRLARQVKMIVTDSSYSRIRIQQVFRICESKIRQAPGGVDQRVFRPRSLAEQQRVHLKYGLPNAYILFVGTLEPRKNLSTLIRAWKHIRDQIQHLHLVIAGAPGRQFQNRETGRDVHDPSICWVGRVEDADLPALYSGALLFVWPSLYEGFGLPPLEAMACGTPVVAGDATALPEVIGEAGTLVPARSEEKLAAAVLNLAENEDLRREFIRKGFERVQSFTWERTASFVQEAIEVASK
jgi:glycosyltransferase involved in cell wall biosynthesis